MGEFDYDWIIVGSGFGGSTSALRLAEKGYSVAVIECGDRFTESDYAESTGRHLNRYYWSPKLKMQTTPGCGTWSRVSVPVMRSTDPTYHPCTKDRDGRNQQ